MSKLPVHNLRNTHESPPIKNRKALADRTDHIINSPVFSNKKKSLNDPMNLPSSIPPPPLRFDQPKPAGSSIPTVSKNDARQRLQRLSMAGASLERSKADKSTRRISFHPGYSDGNSLRDPIAIRRQHENNQRQLKMIEVSRDKLDLLKQKIRQAETKIEELKSSKNKCSRTAIELRNKIGETEVNLQTFEHRIVMARQQLEKMRIHEERMITLQLNKLSTITLTELDTFEAEYQKKLQEAESFSDDKLKQEISDLKKNLELKQEEYSILKEANDKTLEEKKEHLRKELDEILEKQELKDEEFTKIYQEETEIFEKLSSEVEDIETKLEDLNKSIVLIEADISKEQNTFEKFQKSKEELLRELEALKIDNSKLEANINGLVQDAIIINDSYEQANTKFQRERKLRHRIQNSIEELRGKLRVYVRVVGLDMSNPLNIKINREEDNDDELWQNLTIDNVYYRYDKVFGINDSDELVSSETTSLTENNLNGANVSMIFVGHEDNSLITKFVESTMLTLHQREDRYKDNNWEFSYSFQVLLITKEGVIDPVTGSKTQVKLDNRTIISDTTSLSDIEKLKQVLSSKPLPSDSSTLIILSVFAKNPEKQFITTTNFLNLSNIEGTDLIMHSAKKLNEAKYSSSEFQELPMYQLVHHLYSNSKALTFFNINDNKADLDENLRLLEVANIIKSVNAVPVKRVYSTKIDTSV